MKSLDELIELEESLKKITKATKVEIKEATKVLQTRLKVEETELKDTRKMIKKLNRTYMTDKKVHIIDRFANWYNSKDKENSDWIMEDGPCRDNLFDDENRYSTVYTEDVLTDYLWDELQCDDWETEGKAAFDSLDKDKRTKMIEILEDAIEQNLESFLYDW